MECKYEEKFYRVQIGAVLIETLWNVNKVKGKDGTLCQKVLIETLWNVN